MKTYNIQKGDLLVAEPFMKDPNFKRTVTLMCEHNEEGSLGLILTRPSIFRVNEMSPIFLHFRAMSITAALSAWIG